MDSKMDSNKISEYRIYIIIGIVVGLVFISVFLYFIFSGKSSAKDTSSEEQTHVEEHQQKRKGKDDFNGDCLKLHNEYREKHDAEPLEEDLKLVKSATAVAKSNANEGRLHHSKSGPGENLYMHSNPNAPCEYAVKRWYDEIEKYDFSGNYKKGIGHFTQLVWKRSQKLGCGKAVGSRGVFMACHYLPRGNVIGSFNENVVPPS